MKGSLLISLALLFGVVFGVSTIRPVPLGRSENKTTIRPVPLGRYEDKTISKLRLIPYSDRTSEVVDTSRCITSTCNGPQLGIVYGSITDPLVVQSPNFPNQYENNVNCVYDFLVYSGYSVILNIQAMNLEGCPFDFVRIESSDIYGRFSDDVSLCPPNNYAFRLFSIPTRNYFWTLRITFKTDGSVIAGNGFQMQLYPLPQVFALKSCTCGGPFFGSQRLIDGPVERIVNGSVVVPHSIPYMASIVYTLSTTPFCGGTVISKSFILTSASCVLNKSPSQIMVILGEHNWQIIGDGETVYTVASITIHPSFNSPNYLDNDFALLELDQPLVPNANIGIACLPLNPGEAYDGNTLTVSGWGINWFPTGNLSPSLKSATLKAIPNSVCTQTYGYYISHSKVCAKSNEQTDICFGDSGDPLTTYVNGKATVVGVASFTGIPNCGANPSMPSGFAKVSDQRNWILENSDAGNCQP